MKQLALRRTSSRASGISACQAPCQSQGTPLPITTRENSNTNLNFSAYFYGFRGKLVICFEWCKVYTQTEVFQETQQAAVAKAFLPLCFLNATESEKARHKIRLNIKTIPLLNSLSSPRSTSISKITYDHKQQDCNIWSARVKFTYSIIYCRHLYNAYIHSDALHGLDYKQ